MKKAAKLLSMILVLLLFIASLSIVSSAAWDGTAVAAGFASGSGTEDDPYVIATPEQFIFFADSTRGGETYAGKVIRQTADLDFGGSDLYCDAANHMVTGFAGIYNGGGYRFANAKYSKKDAASTPTGIFSTVVGGTVMGIDADAVVITNAYYGGIIAGSVTDGAKVYGCKTEATCSVAGFERIGGIVGSAEGSPEKKSVIECCANAAAVSAAASKNNSYAAGIAGFADGVNILCCLNSAEVTANASGNSKNGVAAGILGVAGKSSGWEAEVALCWNSGRISTPYSGKNSARNYTGGIVGRSANSDGNAEAKSLIEYCVNTGALENASVNETYFGYIGQMAAVYANTGHATVRNCLGLSDVSTALAAAYPEYANGSDYLLGKYGDSYIVSENNKLVPAAELKRETEAIVEKIDLIFADMAKLYPVAAAEPETTAPDVGTEPAATSGPEATTVPEITTQPAAPNPPVTGDDVWIFILAAFGLAAGSAVIIGKRKNNG